MAEREGRLAPPDPANTLSAMLARRSDAARRLPPLDCGCSDPATVRHRTGACTRRVDEIDEPTSDYADHERVPGRWAA